MKKYTKFQLTVMFLDYVDGPMFVTMYDSSNHAHTGYISSIQHEDGSGSSFNITMLTGGGKSETFHIRTID